MIEVFKTNVEDMSQAEKLVALLLQHFPGSTISFDMDDCDKVLRIEGNVFNPEKVRTLVEENGYMCRVLK